MGIDIGFQNNARYWKLVHIKVTNWWYQRYLNGLAVMFFLPRFFLAWYFKCPELTQPLSHDSSKNQTAYQKDIVEQNLAQLFIWTGIHCFVSSINWFRLCKTKYVTEVSGTHEIFAPQQSAWAMLSYTSANADTCKLRCLWSILLPLFPINVS